MKFRWISTNNVVCVCVCILAGLHSNSAVELRMSSGSSTSYHSSTLPNRKGKVTTDGDKGKKVDLYVQHSVFTN